MYYFTNKIRPISHESEAVAPGVLARVNGFFSSAAFGVVQFCETIVVGSWDLASQVVSSTVVKSISNVAAMVTFELIVYAILAVSCILIAFVLNYDQIVKNPYVNNRDFKTDQPQQLPPPVEMENTEVPPSDLPPMATAATVSQPPADVDSFCEFKPSGF